MGTHVEGYAYAEALGVVGAADLNEALAELDDARLGQDDVARAGRVEGRQVGKDLVLPAGDDGRAEGGNGVEREGLRVDEDDAVRRRQLLLERAGERGAARALAVGRAERQRGEGERSVSTGLWELLGAASGRRQASMGLSRIRQG